MWGGRLLHASFTKAGNLRHLKSSGQKVLTCCSSDKLNQRLSLGRVGLEEGSWTQLEVEPSQALRESGTSVQDCRVGLGACSQQQVTKSLSPQMSQHNGLQKLAACPGGLALQVLPCSNCLQQCAQRHLGRQPGSRAACEQCCSSNLQAAAAPGWGPTTMHMFRCNTTSLQGACSIHSRSGRGDAVKADIEQL